MRNISVKVAEKIKTNI